MGSAFVAVARVPIKVSRFPQVRGSGVFESLCDLLTLVATRLMAEKRRIESEEDSVETELLALQQQVNERIARLTRLRKQKKMVVSKGHDMIRRGLRSLDELEEAERQEADAVIDVQSFGGFGVIDWSSLELPSAPSPPVVTPSGSSQAVL